MSHIGVLIKILDMGKLPILCRYPLAHGLGSLTPHSVGGEMSVRRGSTSVPAASPVVTARR